MCPCISYPRQGRQGSRGRGGRDLCFNGWSEPQLAVVATSTAKIIIVMYEGSARPLPIQVTKRKLKTATRMYFVFFLLSSLNLTANFLPTCISICFSTTTSPIGRQTNDLLCVRWKLVIKFREKIAESPYNDITCASITTALLKDLGGKALSFFIVFDIAYNCVDSISICYLVARAKHLPHFP